MDREELKQAMLYEHRFWLQILGDHSRFIQGGLAPKEQMEIQRANYFICIFDELLKKARQQLNEFDIAGLNHAAYRHANEIRQFKLDIIKKHLIGEIDIELSPTFINHMVNEVEEYLRILCCFLSNRIPQYHPVHYHLIWLVDGTGHADIIACSLDTVEEKLIEKSKYFSKTFDEFYNKAMEMAGYMRSNIKRFPALDRFNSQVEEEMTLFMCFLKEIEELEISNKVLGILTPLIPDHMFREECYYLTKLSQVSKIKCPDCDATKPRIE